MTFVNYKFYLDYITEKYNYSNRNYRLQLTDDNKIYEYMTTYEGMNVYPAYPLPIVMPVPRVNNLFDNIKIISINDYQYPNNIELLRIQTYESILNDKIREFEKASQTYSQESVRSKMKSYNKNIESAVRKYFSYEIIDRIKELTKTKNVTNAYVKMYELLITFDCFKDTNKNDVNIFHICEHPGGFVLATDDYIKNNFPNKKVNYMIQSLNPSSDSKIFKPFDELIERFGKNIDYGTKKTGDITDADNILYYINTYKNTNLDLITSDCGWDCSEDYTTQEAKLMPIYFGTIITTIGLSNENTICFFKCFSFNSLKMIELLYLCSAVYHKVYIVRLLTDKSGSGEHYIVMQNMRKDIDKNKLVEILINYYKDYDKKLLFNNFDVDFLDRISEYTRLTILRRITNYNSLIFRINNIDYTDKHNEIKEYVKKFVYYYVDYYTKYLKLTK